MSTWQHRLNILLRTCQECSAVTARPGYKLRALWIENSWFVTTFPSLHFFIFCQITELSYGHELMGHLIYICTSIWKRNFMSVFSLRKQRKFCWTVADSVAFVRLPFGSTSFESRPVSDILFSDGPSSQTHCKQFLKRIGWIIVLLPL
jgi:hypothetical protein